MTPVPASFHRTDAEWSGILERGVPSPSSPRAPAGDVLDQEEPSSGVPIPSWVQLPHGEECEHQWVTMWCKNCGVAVEVKRHFNRCQLPTCPSCHSVWTADQADRMTARLWHGKKFVKGRVWELMVMPPRGVVEPTPDAVESFLKRVYAIGKEHGMSGGNAVVHYEMRESPGEWRPHAHLLGYVVGRWTPGPSSEGWTIKFNRIGPGKDDLRDKSAYEVGHCLRRPGKHAVRWWGSASYSAWKNPTKDELKRMGLEPQRGRVCPTCGAPLMELDWVDLERIKKGKAPAGCGAHQGAHSGAYDVSSTGVIY